MDAIILVCSIFVAINLVQIAVMVTWDRKREKEHRKSMETAYRESMKAIRR
jgi:hypothetical protein